MALALLGCGESGGVELSPPSDRDALLFVRSDDGIATVSALSASFAPIRLSVGNPLTLTWVPLARSLAELGLVEGAVGFGFGRPVAELTGAVVFETRVGPAGATPWAERELPSTVAQARVPATTPLSDCGRYVAHAVSSPEEIEIYATAVVVGVDGSATFAGLGSRPNKGVIGTFGVDGSISLTELPSGFVRVNELAEGPGRTVFGVDASSTLFQVDEVGSILRWPAPESSLRLAEQPNLPPVAYGRGGVYALTKGSTGSVRLDEYPNDLKSLTIVAEDRKVALTTDGIHFFDGEAWRREWSAAGSDLEVTSVGGDDRVLFALAGVSMLVRDDDARTWQPVTNDPLPLEAKLAGAAFGGGRILTAGTSGALIAWLEEERCALPSGTISDLEVLDLAPNRRWALALANNSRGQNLRTVFVRLELP